MRSVKRRIRLSAQERYEEPEPSTPVFFRALKASCIKAIDEKRRSVSVVASTEAIDSHGELVEQVWDLSRYEQNPIVLWNHSAGGFFGSDALPIGRAENVRVEDQGTDDARLEADLVFASAKANPQAEHIFQLYKEKVLRAVSVGFRPGAIRYEEIDGKDVEVLSKNVLLEISATPIGANPEALAKSLELERSYRASMQKDLTPSNERGGETETESVMDNKLIDELNREKAALESKVVELNGKLEKSEARCDALSERCDSLEKARTEQQERADKLSAELTDRDLKALIGVKITPAEKAGLVKLAVLDRELYDSQLDAIKARPDMAHLKQIIQDDPAEVKPRSYAEDNGASLHSAVSALAQS
jgi:HK97 family phage prohead protease